ncbi:MAG TPA: S8 family serine peptidase, partial [Verrucomicrobiae bacterium]|nr:S8 family serine peptidase [Verrucomicrobiae bacterium]
GRTVIDGRFNASLNPSQSWNAGSSSNYFTTYVSPGGTVWDLASASNNICPNDYVHRTQWTDISGVARSNSGQGNPGELWTGSGFGPTYDGRFGVDLSAPGDSVFTCYNTNSYWATARFNLIQDGLGLYGRASAVSAASPLVTGIIALMLQANPQLDAPTVKAILQKSARADSFTGAVPNTKWGYGKVDAYSAVAMAVATLPPFSLTVDPGPPLQVRVAPAAIGNKYVLQSSTNLLSWTSFATNSASTNAVVFQDGTSASRTRFYRVVRAF